MVKIESDSAGSGLASAPSGRVALQWHGPFRKTGSGPLIDLHELMRAQPLPGPPTASIRPRLIEPRLAVLVHTVITAQQGSRHRTEKQHLPEQLPAR